MIINYPWSRTKKTKCRDGSIKIVHRDIDKAYPLFIKEKDKSFNADVAAKELGTANLRNEYAERIKGLLYHISDQNDSLMMSFRIVYLTFSTDPCSNAEMLVRQTEIFTHGIWKLKDMKLQIVGLVDLARSCPDKPDLVYSLYERIITQFGLSTSTQLAKDAIAENTVYVHSWINRGNQNG